MLNDTVVRNFDKRPMGLFSMISLLYTTRSNPVYSGMNPTTSISFSTKYMISI